MLLDSLFKSVSPVVNFRFGRNERFFFLSVDPTRWMLDDDDESSSSSSSRSNFSFVSWLPSLILVVPFNDLDIKINFIFEVMLKNHRLNDRKKSLSIANLKVMNLKISLSIPNSKAMYLRTTNLKMTVLNPMNFQSINQKLTNLKIFRRKGKTFMNVLDLATYKFVSSISGSESCHWKMFVFVYYSSSRLENSFKKSVWSCA